MVRPDEANHTASCLLALLLVPPSCLIAMWGLYATCVKVFLPPTEHGDDLVLLGPFLFLALVTLCVVVAWLGVLAIYLVREISSALRRADVVAAWIRGRTLNVGRLREVVGPTRCAYCLSALDPSSVGCDRCGTWLHSDCSAALGRCPTLGCGPRVSRRTQRPTPRPAGWVTRRRAAWSAWIVVAGITLYYYPPLRLIQAVVPIPFEQAPGRWHLRGVDADRLRAACCGLMKDPSAHELYGERFQECSGNVKRFNEGRAIATLPRVISNMAPMRVVVAPESVTLTWDGMPAYGYGYGIVVVPEGADTSSLRRSDGSFRRNLELAEGIWSYYLWH